jgi:hypothetical protein
MHASRLGVVLCALVTVPSAARAGDKEACVQAHARAQQLRHQGHLLQARRELLTCSAAACPGVVVEDCSNWLNAVLAEVSSVVLAARDAEGHDLLDVRVLVDGSSVASRIDGLPIEVDPGEHVFRAELADGRFAEIHVVVRAGERARPIALQVASAPLIAPTPTPPRVDRPHRRLPIAGLVVGSIGVAALGAFTGLAVDGYRTEQHLADTCPHSCNPGDVSHVQTQYHVADAMLGVGLVAVAVGTGLVAAKLIANRKAPRAIANATALRLEF